MKNIKFLAIVLFVNLLLINPIFSQGICDGFLQFNISQNGDDLQVELKNLYPSAQLCPVLVFSIDRISYLDSAPNTPITTNIVTYELPIAGGGETLYVYNDNNLPSGTHDYHAVVIMTDFTYYTFTSGEFTVRGATSYDMVWTDKVGVWQYGTTLIRHLPSAWGCNSGAASINTIPSGEDGWVEMTVTENQKIKFFGLSNNNPNACRYTIDYSVFFNGHQLRIYENGQNKVYAANCVVGDVIRVERVGTSIYYKKNGTTIWTSHTPSYGSLIADVSIKDQYGVIGDSRCSHPAYGGLKVDNTDSEKIKVYPNPIISGSNLNLEFDFNSDETEAELHIYNINGQLMHKETVNIQKGENTMSVLLNDDYATGMYTMQLQAREYTLNTKFVIK